MESCWTMEDRRDFKRNVTGRSGDFIGGIDNEALDFSQLEAFINSEGAAAGGYFSESLAGPPGAPNPTPGGGTPPVTTGKLLNVIVENKRQAGHSLPDSPPDSGSEHPYSPSSTCDQQPLQTQEIIYTNLNHGHTYKNLQNQVPDGATNASLLTHHPILTGSDNLILNSGQIILPGARCSGLITDLSENNDPRIIQNRILLQSSDSNGATLTHLDGLTSDGRHMIISAQESADSSPGRQILIQPGPSSQGGSPQYQTDRPLLVETPEHRDLDTSIPYTSPSIDNQLINQSQLINQPQLIDQSIDVIYTNLQNPPKKRKLSQDTPLVKSEPEICPGEQNTPLGGGTTPIGGGASNVGDEDYATSENGACLSDSQYQCIRFQPFQQQNWHVLCDQNLTELPIPHYRVDADKGFNFSNADDAFVCQKKNHFQITCHVQLVGDAQFVKTTEGLQKINSFHLHFYGVKYDCPTQTIRVEQSQSDRSKKPFHPVLVSDSRVELISSQVTKVTVGRLHFSETTSNNMRKKGKPNPEQRYFQLVVGLHAHTSHGHFPVASHASQRIIVRASNPGQFESDVELCWQKGQTQESIFHAGKVGINTDRPDESLVIHGNLKITGHIIQPSDLRAKKNIIECDTAEQLRNVQKLRVVRYEYAPGFASQLNIHPDLADTGVIAQEVAQIIPEAVSPTGDIILDNGRTINNFLVVNKERIFMENVGAVKELCKVTDNLETRIGQLERINRRLNKLKRDDSLKSNSTVTSTTRQHLNPLKCNKHLCQDEPEICTNKFIQIVIVILVLIMAFCLAAITTLYLMEATRYNQISQNNIFARDNTLENRKLGNVKNQIKMRTNNNLENVHQSSYKEKINDLNHRPTLENTISSGRLPMVIGKPSDCPDIDSDIDSSNPCQVFCCAQVSIDNTEIEASLYDKTQKQQPPTLNLTKSQVSLIQNIEKNKIAKPFHSNDIGKVRQRQRRDSDVFWTEQENSYLDNSEQFFIISIHGTNFNYTLTNDYCFDCSQNTFNITYSVPISKYMSDETITLMFKANQPNYKDIEQCENDLKQQECPYSLYWDDSHSKTNSQHKTTLEQIGRNKIQNNIFEIDMINVQYKILTYRASLIQNQNICQLSSSKLGIEYIEYNLNFYRDCDD